MKKKYAKPFKRKVHLPSGEWSYRVERTALYVRNPEGSQTWKRELVRQYYPCGFVDGDGDCFICEYGESHEKELSITPARVKLFIERVCLPKK